MFAQQNEFSQFEGFRKTGIHVSGMLYRAGQVNGGDYHKFGFKNNASLSGRIGFDYVYHHTREFTFRTGLYLDLIPYFNVEFSLPLESLPEGYEHKSDEVFEWKYIGHLAFTIPILYEAKKEMGENFFFSVSGGLDITLLRYGDFGTSVSIGNEDYSEGREVFGMYGYTRENWLLYPGLRLSPGFYFIFDKTLFQVNFTYKKSLMSFFKGEYQFGNLIETANTRGDYKMTGDYFGLGVSVFFRKSNPNR